MVLRHGYESTLKRLQQASQSQHYWKLGVGNAFLWQCWGAVLCIVGHEATSLTSMNEITIKRPFPIVTSKNVSHAWSNGPY